MSTLPCPHCGGARMDRRPLAHDPRPETAQACYFCRDPQARARHSFLVACPHRTVYFYPVCASCMERPRETLAGIVAAGPVPLD